MIQTRLARQPVDPVAVLSAPPRRARRRRAGARRAAASAARGRRRSPASLSSVPSRPSSRTSSRRAPAVAASQVGEDVVVGGGLGGRGSGIESHRRHPSEPAAVQELNRCWVRSRPSVTSDSTASAASVHLERQLLALGGGVVGQHEVGDVLAPRRPADADADPVEVAGARATPRIERSPLWPLSPPPSLTRSVPNGDVQLVVDRDDPLRRHLVERGQRLDRPAGLVHVAARPGQHDARSGRARRRQPALDDVGPAGLVGPEREPIRSPARRRRGSRRCAGGRRRSGRGCPARPPATRRLPCR